MKKIIYTFALLVAIGALGLGILVHAQDATNTTLVVPAASGTPAPMIVGNDRDIHGCIGSAGYSWCAIKQKCLRVWEEPCGPANTLVSSTPGMVPPGYNASGTPRPQEPQSLPPTVSSGFPLNQQGGTTASLGHALPPIVVTIDVNGHVLVRGTLVSISGTILTIKSWGMQFTVDTSNAQIAGTITSVSSFAIGDILGIQGTLNESNPGVITATTVRDWGTSSNTGLKNEPMKPSGASSSVPGFLNNPHPDQQGGGNNFEKPGMPIPGNASSTLGAQGLQQKIQELLDQVNKLRGRIPTSSTQSG